MKEFKGGRAIFTFPPVPIKCAGAPQKIMYLSDDHWRKSGTRNNITIDYHVTGETIFAVKKYGEALVKTA